MKNRCQPMPDGRFPDQGEHRGNLVRISVVILLSHVIGVADAGETLFAVGSEWEKVGGARRVVEGIAGARDGSVYITDVIDDKLIRIDADGTETLIDDATDHANGLAFGPDGRLYGVCMKKPAVLAWNLKTGARETIRIRTPGNDLAITSDGRLFYTWGGTNAVYEVKLPTGGSSKVADVENPNGISLSADGSELLVGRFFADTVLSFPILPEKGLGAPKEAFKAKTPEDGKGLLDGMIPLSKDKILTSTALGLQILSRNGDPELIANPTGQRANYVRMIVDGEGRKWIYAAHVKTLLRRAASETMKVSGGIDPVR
jgi:gluconolactonase